MHMVKKSHHPNLLSNLNIAKANKCLGLYIPVNSLYSKYGIRTVLGDIWRSIAQQLPNFLKEPQTTRAHTCYVCPAQSTCGEWRLCNPQSLTICVHKMADGEDNTCVDSFEGLKLKGWLVKQCYSVGIKKPTEIQRECVPPILQGRDCIGCAKTGSGKTAAFALPILQKLCEDPYGIFAVVLTPTR